ncbi:MAG: GntP family permease [Calditrichaeota bacterium]|nr:GntP family permease [Calditrichota bacterium]
MLTVAGLIVVVALIILAATKWNVHPFLSLLIAGVVMGFLGGLDASATLAKLTEGFGNTLRAIGIVIAFGTIIGTFLERSGGAATMAESVLRLVGEKRAPLAMSITGFIVSIPVFCDSGFVILSALNRALSRRTGISLAVLAVALGTGLYTTHVFVPPTPGPLAAAATLGADVGLVLLLGLLVSVPTAAAGLAWAIFYAKRFRIEPGAPAEGSAPAARPNAAFAFAPIVVPIVLIALRSVADYPAHPFGTGFAKAALDFVGHPVIALLVGVGLGFALARRSGGGQQLSWVTDGLRDAGVIILITGAGGAFGNVLRATGVGQTIGQAAAHWHLGLLLPFAIAALLKTAQGSSTVAIITTSALMVPLLPSLGLNSEVAKALVVLAIGAGSMTVSHLNDSYFWVVAQFSDMDTATALRAHTLATLVQGLVGAGTVALLGAVLL